MSQIDIRSEPGGGVIFSHSCPNNSYSATFAAAKKAHVSLKRAHFHNVVFEEGTDFSDLDLESSYFVGCIFLPGTRFNRATLTGTAFVGCNFRGAALS